MQKKICFPDDTRDERASAALGMGSVPRYKTPSQSNRTESTLVLRYVWDENDWTLGVGTLSPWGFQRKDMLCRGLAVSVAWIIVWGRPG